MNGQNQHSRPRQEERPSAKNWANDIQQNWITDCLTDAAANFAKDFGKHLVSGTSKEALTTNQIRIFFGEVRKIQMNGYEKNKGSFVMLKPRLAFAKFRASKELKENERERHRFYDFEKVMLELMKHVSDDKTFQNFADMFEAIVAFHRANNGK